jgi:hypothetical protein
MKRIYFIDHKGTQILYVDFSNLLPSQLPVCIEEAKKIIGAEPENSLLTLTNVTNMRFDYDSSQTIIDFSKHNKPYIKAAAVIGISGIQTVILNSVKISTKREFAIFDDIEKAKDWLAEEGAK